jgi:uncharacterized phage protein (TIGR01671 family)
MNLFTYRGKRLDNGKWTYGDKVAIRNSKGVETIGIKDTIYHVNDGYCNVIPDEIDPSTLGVCWGRKDKNGKDVFTGHWLKVKTQRSQEYGPDKPYEAIMQVVWRPEFESFCLETKEDQDAIKNGSNHYKYAFDPEYRDNDRVYFTSQVEDYEIEIIEGSE